MGLKEADGGGDARPHNVFRVDDEAGGLGVINECHDMVDALSHELGFATRSARGPSVDW